MINNQSGRPYPWLTLACLIGTEILLYPVCTVEGLSGASALSVLLLAGLVGVLVITGMWTFIRRQ